MKNNNKLAEKSDSLKESLEYTIANTKDLIPYANNSRTHSDKQVAQIAASIAEFGFVNPILIGDDNIIIAGHGRLLAAQKLKMDKVPAIIVRGLNENQRKALIIADNRIALSAGWDEELLSLELKMLLDDGYDLTLTGFDDNEISKFIQTTFDEGLTDEDAVPEIAATAVSVMGDTWVLGDHRLRCGDSTSADDVSALPGAVKPHLMVTDPPYGVEYDPSWRNKAGINKSTKKSGIVENDDKADWSEAWALFPGNIAYVWHAGLFSGIVGDSLEACDFKLRSQIIWAKDRFALSRGDYHWHHEPCWYAVKGTGNWCGDRKQSTLWEIKSREEAGVGHSTQKPVECMKRPILNNSSPGQAIYEPFSGSGTTIIAGEQTGRSIYAMELNPLYVDMAIKRWQEFSGKQATLESTGETFADLSTKRVAA